MKDHAMTDYEISQHRRYAGHIVRLESVNEKGQAKIIVGADGSWMLVLQTNLEPLTPFDIGLLKERPAMRYNYAVQQAVKMEHDISVLKEAIENAMDNPGEAHRFLRRAAAKIDMKLNLEWD